MASSGFCRVYRVRFRLGLQMSSTEKRYHNVIFIETQPDLSGEKIHITGSVTDGYRYERVSWKRPENSRTFVSKDFLGFLSASDHAALVAICEEQPVPSLPQQKWRGDGLRGGWARCKQDGSYFADGETIPPFFRCTEWTENYTMPALQRSGLLQPAIPAQSSEQVVAQTAQPTAASASTEWVWDEGEKKYRYWDGSQWIWQG